MPLPIDRVAGKSASNMVVYSAVGNLFECKVHMVEGWSVGGQCRVAKKKYPVVGQWEFRLPPVPSVDLIEPALPRLNDTAYVGLCILLDRKSTRLNSSHVKISYA